MKKSENFIDILTCLFCTEIILQKTGLKFIAFVNRKKPMKETMFKNITICKINQAWNQDLATAEESLISARFIECGPFQEKSMGWVEPRGEANGAMIESIGGQWILKIQSESKILPGSVVKAATKKKCDLIEQTTGRKPGKKEKREISDEIRQGLLAQSFTKISSSYVWIDRDSGILVVESPSQTYSDQVLTFLVKCLEGFAISLLCTKNSPSACMSSWLTDADNLPPQFTADRDCVLKAPDESRASIRYARHALDTDDVRAHIANGKIPSSLAMTWEGRVSFVLSDSGSIKKIDFLDVLFGETKDSGFDADVAISTGELKKMIPDLIDALGGESKEV